MDDLIVDNFAGGGGASYGIELALGRSPDIAVNHDPEAIAMHTTNHADTRHFCESVCFTVDNARLLRKLLAEAIADVEKSVPTIDVVDEGLS